MNCVSADVASVHEGTAHGLIRPPSSFIHSKNFNEPARYVQNKRADSDNKCLE